MCSCVCELVGRIHRHTATQSKGFNSHLIYKWSTLFKVVFCTESAFILDGFCWALKDVRRTLNLRVIAMYYTRCTCFAEHIERIARNAWGELEIEARFWSVDIYEYAWSLYMVLGLITFKPPARLFEYCLCLPFKHHEKTTTVEFKHLSTIALRTQYELITLI